MALKAPGSWSAGIFKFSSVCVCVCVQKNSTKVYIWRSFTCFTVLRQVVCRLRCRRSRTCFIAYVSLNRWTDIARKSDIVRNDVDWRRRSLALQFKKRVRVGGSVCVCVLLQFAVTIIENSSCRTDAWLAGKTDRQTVRSSVRLIRQTSVIQ